MVILNRVDYIKKCYEFLENGNFVRLQNDPTKTFQVKVQNTLRKMKTAFDKRTYNKIYPSGSQPGLFFALAKVHKVPENSSGVEDLPFRPIISNIDTATYRISKHLAELLLPLTRNQYTINNTQDFVTRLNGLSIQADQKMVSFDVSSLFSNVPLDYTIDVIKKSL